MGQLEVLRNKVKKWGGEVRGITHDYASGQVILNIFKDGKTYLFPYKDKNATKATEVLAWSVRTLINCDERGILPFDKTAREYLQIEGSTSEPVGVIADEDFKNLGLDKKASNDDVMKAYKRLARELHPDTFAGLDTEGLRADAEKRFSEISASYTAIKKARRF